MPDTGAHDRRIVLEICLDHPASLVAAIMGGADRLELCSALELGGLTPSGGFIAAARCATQDTAVSLHAMVRPRAGDFAYDEGEIRLAIAEAELLIAQGVDGLVFGAAIDGVLDTAALERIAAVAHGAGRPVALTLHRAIDMVDDRPAAVDAAAALGYDRILTSGGALTAVDGAASIRAMVVAAAGRIAIAAGAGVNAANVAALVADTGVGEVHASASAPMGTVDPRGRAFGFAAEPHRLTQREMVCGIRAAIDTVTVAAR